MGNHSSANFLEACGWCGSGLSWGNNLNSCMKLRMLTIVDPSSRRILDRTESFHKERNNVS